MPRHQTDRRLLWDLRRSGSHISYVAAMVNCRIIKSSGHPVRARTSDEYLPEHVSRQVVIASHHSDSRFWQKAWQRVQYRLHELKLQGSKY